MIDWPSYTDTTLTPDGQHVLNITTVGPYRGSTGTGTSPGSSTTSSAGCPIVSSRTSPTMSRSPTARPRWTSSAASASARAASMDSSRTSPTPPCSAPPTDPRASTGCTWPAHRPILAVACPPSSPPARSPPASSTASRRDTTVSTRRYALIITAATALLVASYLAADPVRRHYVANIIRQGQRLLDRYAV